MLIYLSCQVSVTAHTGCLLFESSYCHSGLKICEQPAPQGQYWTGRTPPPNNGPPNMVAANFVVITNGEGCALNGTAVAAVFIDQWRATCFLSASCDWL